MALNLKERWNSVAAKVGQSTLVVRGRTLYESLSPRDRRLLILLVSFFMLAAIGASAYAGRNYLRRLDQEIARKQGQLQRVEQVRAEHEALQAQISAKEEDLKGEQGFNLTAFLERTATEAGFTEPVNIQSRGETASASTGFKEISVEVKVRKASLDKIVTYLHRIENAPQPLTVKNLRIRTGFGSKTELDAELEVSILAPES